MRLWLSTQITWVMVFFTRNRRIFLVLVLFDVDVAAASKRGSHMLMAGLGVRRRRDHLQESLQEIAHALICRSKILQQRVLKHAVGIDRFEIGEQEPIGALRHMLQHLFDLLWRVSPADLFQYSFAL